MEVTDEFAFGAQVGLLNLVTENVDVGLHLGIEAGYNLGMATPYLGLEFPDLLAEGDLKMELLLGSTFEINEMFGAGVELGLGVAGNGDLDMPINLKISFSFNF